MLLFLFNILKNQIKQTDSLIFFINLRCIYQTQSKKLYCAIFSIAFNKDELLTFSAPFFKTTFLYRIFLLENIRSRFIIYKLCIIFKVTL